MAECKYNLTDCQNTGIIFGIENAVLGYREHSFVLKLCSGSPPTQCKSLQYGYEGCSNMNASGFITFFTYMLRQNVIPFWKELFVAFKMAPNIKKHSLYFSSYRRLYKDHSCILKSFLSKLQCTFWYMGGYSVITL